MVTVSRRATSRCLLTCICKADSISTGLCLRRLPWIRWKRRSTRWSVAKCSGPWWYFNHYRPQGPIQFSDADSTCHRRGTVGVEDRAACLQSAEEYDLASGVNSGRGVPAEDFFAVLIYRGKLQVDKILAAFLTQGLHRSFGSERIAWPDLLGETHTKFREASIPHIVGQHLPRHAHGEHAVGEHGGIAGDLGGIDLIRMDRVIIPRGASILHDLRSGQVVHHLFGVGIAHLQMLR